MSLRIKKICVEPCPVDGVFCARSSNACWNGERRQSVCVEVVVVFVLLSDADCKCCTIYMCTGLLGLYLRKCLLEL